MHLQREGGQPRLALVNLLAFSTPTIEYHGRVTGRYRSHMFILGALSDIVTKAVDNSGLRKAV
jgi:hypothetical protein